MGAPADFETWFPAYAEPMGRMSHSTMAAHYIPQNSTRQRLYRLTVPDAILDPVAKDLAVLQEAGVDGSQMEARSLELKGIREPVTVRVVHPA